jgi:uncharacterized FlaG/YvyC family protein
MASDGSPGAISGASVVLSSQAAETTKFQAANGKILPQSGNAAALAAAAASSSAANTSQSSNSVAAAASNAATAGTRSASSTSASNSTPAKSASSSSSDPQALVDQINKYLNDSGRADQFRVDPDSDKYIQQVNPASGAVVAEYSVAEFPALARSIGASGLLVDEVA